MPVDLTGENRAEAEPTPPAVIPLATPASGEDMAPHPPPLEAIEADRLAPRFTGEILGVFIAPPDVKPPLGFTTYEEFCGSPEAPTVATQWEEAGALALSVELPGSFVFQPDSVNSGVIACEGKVYAARWDYNYSNASGYPGGLTIARSVFSHITRDVSSSRVKPVVIGGRQAILIEPLTPDGISSSAGVIFPEPFGTTEIQSAGVPLPDLLAVAETVALATGNP
ncbi:MAG TPA: hypothetical protein VFP63_02850 [Dehalococcoidia bacterium]|nr:hypothetical protein [Dehalococcoidia bacterium]